MTFKIVQIIEKGRALLWTVPSSWENKGILRWPTHKVDKLRRDSSSQPAENWKSINCIVKRSNFPSFQSAESVNKTLSDMSDTETDIDNDNTKNWLPTKHAREPQLTGNKYQEMDFNDLILTCDQKAAQINKSAMIENEFVVIQTAETLSQSPAEVHTSNIHIEPKLQKLPTMANEVMIIQSAEELPQSTREQPSTVTVSQKAGSTSGFTSDQFFELKSKIEALSATVSSIESNQSVLCSNQITIIQKIADVSTQLDVFIKRTLSQSQSLFMENSVKRDDEGMKPIADQKSFDDFEESLKDQSKVKELKKSLSRICGEGKGKAITNAYALSDAMFDRKFLVGCSWAGGTRAEGSKICFKTYQKTIELFFQIVHTSDNKFTKQECYTFLKNILRNAKKRCTSQNLRMSHQKKRTPKLKKKEKEMEKEKQSNQPIEKEKDVDVVNKGANNQNMNEEIDQDMSEGSEDMGLGLC